MPQFNKEALKALTRSLHPEVERRILAFAEEINDDLSYGTGTSQTYGVSSVGSAVQVLARFELTSEIPDRNSELIDDYVTFIRSHNVIPS